MVMKGLGVVFMVVFMTIWHRVGEPGNGGLGSGNPRENAPKIQV